SITNAPANADLFGRYRKRLPQSKLGFEVVRHATRGANELSFTLKGSVLTGYRFADFYPLPDEKTIVGHPKTEIRGDEITVTVPLEAGPAQQLGGLFVLGQSENDVSRIGSYVSVGTPIMPQRNGESPAASHSLFAYLLFGFIGGFILNLMPCVLPV